MINIGMSEALVLGANLRDQDRALQQWMNACAERDGIIERLQARVRDLEESNMRLEVRSMLDANSIADLNAEIRMLKGLSPQEKAPSIQSPPPRIEEPATVKHEARAVGLRQAMQRVRDGNDGIFSLVRSIRETSSS
jgi:hypothetical protein